MRNPLRSKPAFTRVSAPRRSTVISTGSFTGRLAACGVGAWICFAWLRVALGADATPGMSFLPAPEGAKPMSLALSLVEGNIAQGYLVQRSNQPLDELASVPPAIAALYSGKEFYAYQIALMPNGVRYLAVLNEDKTIRFLNRNESAVWFSRIYRVSNEPDVKPELLREGIQTLGNDVIFPVEMPVPSVGSSKAGPMRMDIGYGINGNQNGRPQVFSGRGAALQVAGRTLFPQGKLTLTVTLPESFAVTPDTQVTLQFQPLQPGLPERSASGKVTDYLTLGTARFIVTALSPDFSSATLAIAAGSLEQTIKQQLELGTKMPAFSQVDLATRKTVTREEVLSRARDRTGVIFVFGDILPTGGRHPMQMMPPSNRGETTVLPLPPGDIVEQAGFDQQPKPLVVLVTRQIGVDLLYEDLRNKTPEYILLTDFTDPLRTMFRLPPNAPGGWYGPPSQGSDEPSLRQLFNLPTTTTAIVAFDPQGKVVYVKAEAGTTFLRSLAEARGALGESSIERK